MVAYYYATDGIKENQRSGNQKIMKYMNRMTNKDFTVFGKEMEHAVSSMLDVEQTPINLYSYEGGIKAVEALKSHANDQQSIDFWTSSSDAEALMRHFVKGITFSYLPFTKPIENTTKSLLGNLNHVTMLNAVIITPLYYYWDQTETPESFPIIDLDLVHNKEVDIFNTLQLLQLDFRNYNHIYSQQNGQSFDTNGLLYPEAVKKLRVMLNAKFENAIEIKSIQNLQQVVREKGNISLWTQKTIAEALMHHKSLTKGIMLSYPSFVDLPPDRLKSLKVQKPYNHESFIGNTYGVTMLTAKLQEPNQQKGGKNKKQNKTNSGKDAGNVRTGPRGGKFVINNGKKVYRKKK